MRSGSGQRGRVTKPSGLIVVTVHGPFSLAALTRSEELRRLLGLSDADARADLRLLRQVGHLFHPLPAGSDATDLSTRYGNAFCTEAWAEKSWGRFVDIVGFIPVRFWFVEDVLVMKPRR